jgi:hypothetical protein
MESPARRGPGENSLIGSCRGRGVAEILHSVAASLREPATPFRMTSYFGWRGWLGPNGGRGSAPTAGSRPLFGEDVVNFLHDPFCALHRSRDQGGGSRTLPGIEEIIGGSQVTSHEGDGKPSQVRVNGIPPLRKEREGVGHPRV